MSMTTPRVVTFGEMLLRLSPPGNERLFASPHLQTFWGGAEANVAAGLSHLGVSAQHVTVLPEGAVGDAAERAMQGEGVDTQHVLRVGTRMGLYFLERGAGAWPLQVIYDRANSAFAELDPSHFDWATILRGAAWFHVCGISPALGAGPLRCVMQALEVARAIDVPVSVDLNYRPALWAGRDPRPVMQPIAAHANLLIGNPGAIDVMLGVQTAGRMPEAAGALAETAQRLHDAYGCARVAITQRTVLSPEHHEWQAHLWEAGTRRLLHGGHFSMAVVDRVGGGDAFAAALLHQLLHGAEPDRAVRFATAASALKLTIPGDVNRSSVADVEWFLTSRALA